MKKVITRLIISILISFIITDSAIILARYSSSPVIQLVDIRLLYFIVGILNTYLIYKLVSGKSKMLQYIAILNLIVISPYLAFIIALIPVMRILHATKSNLLIWRIRTMHLYYVISDISGLIWRRVRYGEE